MILRWAGEDTIVPGSGDEAVLCAHVCRRGMGECGEGGFSPVTLVRWKGWGGSRSERANASQARFRGQSRSASRTRPSAKTRSSARMSEWQCQSRFASDQNSGQLEFITRSWEDAPEAKLVTLADGALRACSLCTEACVLERGLESALWISVREWCARGALCGVSTATPDRC